MKYSYVLAVTSFLVTSLFAQEEPLKTPQEKQHELEENIKSQTQGNNAFALALYGRLSSTPGNLFFSPFSISSALAIPYAGSAGPTRAQMQSVLHFISEGVPLFETFFWLNRQLTTSWFSGPNETKAYIANSLWIQRGLPIQPSFYEYTAKYFGAALKQTDFQRNPSAALLNINDWVKERTQGRIVNLLSQSDVTSNTKLVVVSTIFLRAVWERAFDPSLTVQSPFFTSMGNTSSVEMMTASSTFPIYQGHGFTLLELPYRGGQTGAANYSCLVFLPLEIFGLKSVEAKVSSVSVETWLQNLHPARVIVSLPKFKISQSFSLKTTLQQMGMSIPFSEGANFTGITTAEGLALDDVIHKAYLSLDEKGTEAVAATAVTIGRTMALPEQEPPIVFKADHPFQFMIIDRTTNSIVFIGRFVYPE